MCADHKSGMSSKAETSQSVFDTVKLGASLLLIVAALVAFYYYADASKLTRVVGLIAATGVALGIASQTDKGRALLSFGKEAQVEVRKVVWPTRQETIQTTLVVMVVVIIVALFLWLLDMLLAGVIKMLMGQGG